MAKDITLLWGAGSPPCWRVMIALEEKNLQGYEEKRFYFEKMEHKSAEVMAINPRGQLPAFKIGGSPINESYATVLYLEDQFKSQGTKLTPDAPAEKAMMYQRMMEGNTLMQKIGDVLYYNFAVPEGERHDSAIKRKQEALATELKIWDEYLAGGCCLAGKSFSLADVAIFPIFAYLFHHCPMCETRFPNIGAYYKSLKDRPSIKTSWPPAWFENPQGQEFLKGI